MALSELHIQRFEMDNWKPAVRGRETCELESKDRHDRQKDKKQAEKTVRNEMGYSYSIQLGQFHSTEKDPNNSSAKPRT